MTTVADTATTSRFVAESAEIDAAASLPLQREVHRLADTLLPLFSGAAFRCVHLMDLGSADQSSLWLAAAVGSALGVRLKTKVHVLSIEAELSRDRTPPSTPAPMRGCILESLTPGMDGNGRGSLGERLSELRAANQPVLLHSAEKDGLPEELLNADEVYSVVLLARASQTRRAALQATVQRLELAGASLLGCVLLDRRYPIPEKLYHLL